jgi:hypothetical protein
VGPDTASRYLRSRDRAALARSYLLDRFQLDPASTGAVALGSEAMTGSPSGGGWDGVALAVFVQPRAMGKE